MIGTLIKSAEEYVIQLTLLASCRTERRIGRCNINEVVNVSKLCRFFREGDGHSLPPERKLRLALRGAKATFDTQPCSQGAV